MLKKLKLRFVLINMVIVAAMLLIIFSLVYNFTDRDLKKQSDNALQTLLQQGGRVQRGDIPFPYFVLRVNAFGDYTVTGNTYYDLTDQEFLTEILQKVYDNGAFSGKIDSYDLQYQVADGLGVRYFAFIDISGQKATLHSLVEASLLIGASSMLIFLVISILLATWSVKPVDKAWKQQRQFISDASHELKTPLTVIMSNAELLQSEDCTEENRAQFSENILTMSHQMRSLVEGLLELSRVDNGQVKKAFAPLDLSHLTEDCMLPFEPVLFDKGMTLAYSVEPGIRLNGNENYLRQMIDTLLDNAGKYGTAGIVQVQLVRQGHGHCLLSVANPGTPIPREELGKIFERFYRSDAARTRDGSFGLGLSIAQSVAEEHGGKIWAESNETGNCFYISLPILN